MSVYLKHIRFALLALMLCVVGAVQAQTVKGNVKDATGEPIIGATIMEQGVTGNGTVTDIDGNFTLQLKGKSKKVTVSYVGMTSQTLAATEGKALDVTLKDNATNLNDVVVIGYGSVKKKDLTGSVATVDSKTLAKVPVASASEALQGKMAGVQVSATEGSPDATVKIRVRGGGSITQSNDPLFIVDGFPVDDISNIPASEIEDMTVLKDASSTAIYGSRGANGVILITTRAVRQARPRSATMLTTAGRRMPRPSTSSRPVTMPSGSMSWPCLVTSSTSIPRCLVTIRTSTSTTMLRPTTGRR